MADGQKYNIPLGGYGKGMSLGLRPRDIPMPYPPSGILSFYQSAMWSCYIIPQMCHFQWNTSRWILRWIFNGSWQGTTSVIKCPFWTYDVICGIKARQHGWWTKTQYPTRWIWHRDVTWPTARDISIPYPPHGILRFYPSAMRSCYNLRRPNLGALPLLHLFPPYELITLCFWFDSNWMIRKHSLGLERINTQGWSWQHAGERTDSALPKYYSKNTWLWNKMIGSHEVEGSVSFYSTTMCSCFETTDQ